MSKFVPINKTSQWAYDTLSLAHLYQAGPILFYYATQWADTTLVSDIVSMVRFQNVNSFMVSLDAPNSVGAISRNRDRMSRKEKQR